MLMPELILSAMQAGKLLERTCPSGDVHEAVYRLDGCAVKREDVEALEASGPRLVVTYGYTTYAVARPPAQAY